MDVKEIVRPDPVPLEEVRASVGQEVGVSPWRTVTQEMIDTFAEATDDYQFIHIDPVRAAAETSFGGTVAHGFLTLSLLSAMGYEALPPIQRHRRRHQPGLRQAALSGAGQGRRAHPRPLLAGAVQCPAVRAGSRPPTT